MPNKKCKTKTNFCIYFKTKLLCFKIDTTRPYKDVQNLFLQSLVFLGYKLCLRNALGMNEKISERLYKKLWATSSFYFMHDDGSV